MPKIFSIKSIPTSKRKACIRRLLVGGYTGIPRIAGLLSKILHIRDARSKEVLSAADTIKFISATSFEPTFVGFAVVLGDFPVFGRKWDQTLIADRNPA